MEEEIDKQLLAKHVKKQIYGLLEDANGIYIGESPLLTDFPVCASDGEIVFHWKDDDNEEHTIVIPEKNLGEAVYVPETGYKMFDEGGDEIFLEMFIFTNILNSQIQKMGK